MTVPGYQALMRPVLEVLADADGPIDTMIVAVRVADRLGLTEADRAEVTSIGKPLVENRVSFSLSFLGQAGMLDRPARRMVQINDAGRRLLASGDGPVRVDRYPEFRARVEE